MGGALQQILVLLGITVLAVMILMRLRLPPILGYLVTGLLVGPYGLGWFDNTEETRQLAEFGVVFLLFTLGLEVSLPRLLVMKKEVLVLGSAQVAVTTLMAVGLSGLFDISPEIAIVIGGAFAMSSTAIVAKQLKEQLELHQPHGRLSIGILLFQDIAVVPFIILIASIGGDGGQSLWEDLGMATVKGAIALAIVLAIGRWLLRPLFHEVAKTRSAEIFTLAVLLFTLASAWATHEFGLSLALGAFLAGMMLGETEFRHQVEADIRPFRDMLLGLFFVTIGMLVNPHAMEPVIGYVLLGAFSLMVFKLVTITLLGRLVSSNWNASLRAGIVLAHSGEFSFALLTLAIGQDLLGESLAQIALGSIMLSMVFSPLLIRHSGRLARFVQSDQEDVEKDMLEHAVARHELNTKDHVIICGYGRVGQNIARFLEKEGFDYIALDLDPYRVRSARAAGDPVYYGDATHLDVLHAAGLDTAKILVQSYYGVEISMKILEQVRGKYPDLPILIRTRDDTHLDKLQSAGATEVVPETLEASLMMSAHVMSFLGVPMRRILKDIQDVREHRYELLRSVFRGQDAQRIDETHALREQLATVKIKENSEAAGRQLQTLNLERFGVVVTGLRRDGILGRQPDPDTELRSGDVLVLFGTPEDLDRAENEILKRPD
ncbi:MAG: monovalent cation:proton antiporter-2 (CPA2) family protein [Gammaproteobacteria bacterium]|nr:monovalent cation:proton antiporter-2 (CPA2) family protein [Gammaproteobacteria bacterium]